VDQDNIINKKERVVMIYSGGMDSYTLLMQMLSESCEVHAISFNYGQRHSKELEFAKAVAAKHGFIHKIIDVSGINELLQGSSLTSDIDVPHGHYEEESMKATVVPNRNAIMLNMALGYAISVKADELYYGAHGGDHAIYPDCRPEFVSAMHALAQVCDYHKVRVSAPYITLSKGEIAVIGRDLGIDYGMSWTCYEGGEKACGKCGACQERLEAMQFAGLVDPLVYADA